MQRLYHFSVSVIYVFGTVKLVSISRQSMVSRVVNKMALRLFPVKLPRIIPKCSTFMFIHTPSTLCGLDTYSVAKSTTQTPVLTAVCCCKTFLRAQNCPSINENLNQQQD